MHCIGNLGKSCEFWRLSLEKPTKIHHNSGVLAVCANYDGFLWVFPRKVVRIRMTSRDSLYNAPAKKASNRTINTTHKNMFSNLLRDYTHTQKLHRKHCWGIICVTFVHLPGCLGFCTNRAPIFFRWTKSTQTNSPPTFLNAAHKITQHYHASFSSYAHSFMFRINFSWYSHFRFLYTYTREFCQFCTSIFRK